MNRRCLYGIMALSMALGVGSIGAADALLSPGDKIVAVGGSLINQSSYPAAPVL